MASLSSRMDRDTLRHYPRNERYFWRPFLTETLTLKAKDHTANGDRNLVGNEIIVLALNEIAAVKGDGFFLYVQPRTAWTGWGNLYPQSRQPPPPR